MSGNAVESSCDALASLFAAIINDMKESWPAFEDLVNKATKLHSSLRTTMLAASSFLESFQKVADIATNARGATKDIGKALTRLSLRQKGVENKLRVFTSALTEGLVSPMQEKMEDWKRSVVQLDKDHARDQKKACLEIKKALSEKTRLEKKAKKGKTTYSKGEASEKLESAIQNLTNKYLLLEDAEKKGIRRALIEERQHYCHFITCIDPMVKAEVSLVNEAAHLQEILDCLCSQAADPDNLPEASEHVIIELKGHAGASAYHEHATPPDSPTGPARSRKSSASSDDSSQASTSEADSAIGSSPKHQATGLKLQIPRGSTGLVSIASQDSGFTSQDTLCCRPNLPAVGVATTAGATAIATSPAASDNALLIRQESKSPDVLATHSRTATVRGEGDHYQVGMQASALGASAAGSGSSQPLHRGPGGPSASMDWLPATDRPHTVSGAGSHFSRPALQPDTFVPPSQLIGKQSSSTEHMGSSGATRQDRAAGLLLLAPLPPSSSTTSPPASSLLGMLPKSGKPGLQPGGSVRVLPPPPARSSKAKPIATPLIPPQFAPEPVYMNPQELPIQSAQPSSSSSNESPNRSSAAAVAAEEKETRASTALADAIRELEESTAALEAFVDAAPGCSMSTHPATMGRDQQAAVASTWSSGGDARLVTISTGQQQGQQPVPCSVAAEAVADAAGDRSSLDSSSCGGATLAHAQAQLHMLPSAIDYDALRISQGDTVMTWAGQAVMRRPMLRPPPPTRTSSASVTTGELSPTHEQAPFDTASLASEPACGDLMPTNGDDSNSELALPPPPPPEADAVYAESDSTCQLVPPPAEWCTDLNVTIDYDDLLPPPPPPLHSSPQPLSPGQLFQQPTSAAVALPPPPPLLLHCIVQPHLLPVLASPPLPPPPPHEAANSAVVQQTWGDRNSLTKSLPPAVAQKPRNLGIQQPVLFAAPVPAAGWAGSQTATTAADGRSPPQQHQQVDDSAANRTAPTAVTEHAQRLSAAKLRPEFAASLNAKLGGPIGPMVVRGKDKSHRTSDVDEPHAGVGGGHVPGDGSYMPPPPLGPHAAGAHVRKAV